MYYKRYVEEEIRRRLRSSGAVLIKGPKFCGKSTTARLFAKSSLVLDGESVVSSVRISPKDALIGEKPRLIDEWQRAPQLWDAIKSDLDKEYVFGKYILTGSATPADTSSIFDSGAGRISILPMYTLSLYESGESSGRVSLGSLFKGEGFSPRYDDGPGLRDIAYLLCRGGWPISVLSEKGEAALDSTRYYYEGLFNFSDSDNSAYRSKDSELLTSLLKSYARNVSTEAGFSVIKGDLGTSRDLTPYTFNQYVRTLRDLFIIADLPAWSPAIRSKTAIRTTPTIHFIDTSLAACALGLSPDDLLGDFRTFGFFFEDFAIRDLRIYASALGGELRHYRDGSGLECDAILHLRDGSWGAIEIKIGGEEAIEKGAKSLTRLKEKMGAKSDLKGPSFLMVLTGVGPTYQRKDGVYVVSITDLKA